jgi:hypothetical protein
MRIKAILAAAIGIALSALPVVSEKPASRPRPKGYLAQPKPAQKFKRWKGARGKRK